MTRSVVQLLVMVDGSMALWGSGSVISDDGLILTNAHVVTPDLAVDEIQVAVTTDADVAPQAMYRAEVRAADVALDLAVVQMTETLEGEPYEDGEIRPMPVGDSDAVSIGDDLLIFGYPRIGGETITFTRGLVSGFTSDEVVGERAWIKTDATVAGGNSGGTAASTIGELVGIPTNLNAGTNVDPVDCRPMRDTDRDGDIDADDVCVPLGGFLNGVRPVNVAAPMIDAVSRGVAYQPIGGEALPPIDFSPEDVAFGRPSFIDHIPTDRPPPGFWLPGGMTQLCAWWAYSGMADGVRWAAIWSHDGQIRDDLSQIDGTWVGGPEGEWWTCIQADGPIDEGIWDLALHVQDERVNGSFVGIGEELRSVTLTFANRHHTQRVCWLFVSPRVTSFWGDDWLGGDDVLRPGESRSFDLPPATYDIRGEDCERNVLMEVTRDIIGPTEIVYE